MDKEKVKEMMERYKVLAETLLSKDIPVYVKDIFDDIYMANILFVGEEKLTFQCFAPPRKENRKYSIRWETIIKLAEYEK